MLHHLYIRNYALFAETEVRFQKGLNILTGETGAGKSLLVGALGLITGKRADSSVVFRANEKCVVEATFRDLASRSVDRIRQFEDFDFSGEELLIRREINPSGKSRAFINDTPVSLQLLREVSNWLLDMHGQHDNQQLLSHENQLELLDAYADCGKKVEEFAALMKESQQMQSEIQALKAKEEKARTEWDYIKFQRDELEAAGIQAEEETNLEQELQLLQNSETVREALGLATEGLYHQEMSVYQQLSELLEPLQKVAKVSDLIREAVEKLQEVQETFKETTFSLQEMLETIESDPERLAFIEERLALYYQLKRKYGLGSGEELMQKLEDLRSQMTDFESISEQIAEKEAKYQKHQEKCISLGLKIETARIKAKPKLEKQIHALLSEVGFQKARFEVAVERQTGSPGWLVEGKEVKPSPSGLNKVYFLIQTNPGMPAGPLSQIASGGEIARVMLAIKAALAEKSEFPVLIFDEIDTGISGEIANKVGVVMRKLADSFQILSITHLPQIAAKGHHHFQIYKRIEGNQTTSDVNVLNQENRVIELAKMLSGDQPSDSAIQNATELMEQVP